MRRLFQNLPEISSPTPCRVVAATHVKWMLDCRTWLRRADSQDSSYSLLCGGVGGVFATLHRRAEGKKGKRMGSLVEKGILEAAKRILADARDERRSQILARLNEVSSKEVRAFSGKYDVIVIDPPWPMQKIERDVRPNQVAFDYPTMTENQLSELELPAGDDCHMWLWTTHKFMPMAFRLLNVWGFKYVCTFVWHKPGGFQPIGLPQYNCEFALYARKGSPSFINTKAFPACFEAPRGAHSEKPEEFYDMVRRVTAGVRIDIFNRRRIDGFDVWGNEAHA